MSQPTDTVIDQRVQDFEAVLQKIEQSRTFGKATHVNRLLGYARRLLETPKGVARLYTFAPRFESSGMFWGGDWAEPQNLQPALVAGTLRGGGANATMECLSELRLLAIVDGITEQPQITAAEAREFLEQVLAANLDLLFPVATEESRETDAAASQRVSQLFDFILDRLGASAILLELTQEVERVMLQRPIMTQRVESLLRSAERAIETNGSHDDELGTIEGTARQWIHALNGPSELSRKGDYIGSLAKLDADELQTEAETFAHSLNKTGLVSYQHADLVRFLAANAPDQLATALDLGTVGRVSLDQHRQLVHQIIEYAIWWETTRSIYGLSRLLNQGTLFIRPVPPSLHRLMALTVHEHVAERLRSASDWYDPPAANIELVAATLSVLGQPRGVDQGYNPTCQSARAISLWAHNDPGYLLELIASAARDDELVMQFEDTVIHSGGLQHGLAAELHTELDPVSLVLTPHIDRIYMEMSRYTFGRSGDGHRWVNPEMHGWWVMRGFAELVDTATGAITDCNTFIRRFYTAYHPLYNGGRDLVYAQPCGIASTTATGAFVGWHAISIQRVAPDPDGIWRVYFFNPNREKGQDWGRRVITSTNDCGEFEGESSLPFGEFLSRLYVFHYKPEETGAMDNVDEHTVALVRSAIADSWGLNFRWVDNPL